MDIGLLLGPAAGFFGVLAGVLAKNGNEGAALPIAITGLAFSVLSATLIFYGVLRA